MSYGYDIRQRESARVARNDCENVIKKSGEKLSDRRFPVDTLPSLCNH